MRLNKIVTFSGAKIYFFRTLFDIVENMNSKRGCFGRTRAIDYFPRKFQTILFCVCKPFLCFYNV